MTVPLHTIDLDGPLTYTQWGGRGQDRIVLVHGLGSSHVSWLDIGPLLTASHHVLAPDQVGFGETEPLGRSSRIGPNAVMLGRFIEATGEGPVTLVGNSMGGMISIQLAAHRPELVSSLVLVDPALPLAVPRQPLRTLDPRVAAMFIAYNIPVVGERFMKARRDRLTAEQTVRVLFEMVCHDPAAISESTWKAAVAQVERRRDYTWSDQAFLEAERSIMRWLTLGRREYLGRLSALPMPTRLVHGVHDTLVPVANAREVASRNPDLDYVELDHVGHAPQLEDPALIADLILEWAGVTREVSH